MNYSSEYQWPGDKNLPKDGEEQLSDSKALLAGTE